MKRIVAVAALAGSVVLAPAVAAHAASDDPDPAPAVQAEDRAAAQVTQPGPSDMAAARSAANSVEVRQTLGRFFANKGAPPAQGVQPPAVAARVGEQMVVVNYLNPAFVAGSSSEVAQFAFLATPATSADGQTASIWTTRSRTGRWEVSNIASGDDEQRYASQPGKIFREPQINAWYALRGGRIVPLNDEARGSVGDQGMPLADYQRLVAGRYADKLPGSAYANDGAAGGYGPGPVISAEADPGDVPPLWGLTMALLLGGGTVTWTIARRGGRKNRPRKDLT
ncbi:hypothetical protein ACFHYQ_21070 [Sphaerimonospora cavernae]|uniref:Secreted protein n=1 Tax=Sphaerimonospora cavernae TaxID=1740611 RepID=A0ABV6U9C8_9ACTN